MKRFILYSFLLFTLSPGAKGQENYYFPPISGDSWEMTLPEELGWNVDYTDSLDTFLENENTKACIILYKGKIVYEKYFGSFSSDSLWYWASAGKTITAFLVGKAQEQGYLNITDTSSLYLGKGWTSCAPEKEEKITIWHQLTMTTGFKTSGINWDCTDPECLNYLTDAGSRWFYHNAPYTVLKDVLTSATGLAVNTLTNQWLKNEIGMGGFWLQSGWNNLYISRARDMAKFGSLILNQGDWNGKVIMSDKDYVYNMTHTSQDLNPAYGYLFWLNGKEKYIQPGLAIEFQGSIIPEAPADMYAALGKNDQKLYIVPSKELVVVRMGNAARESLLALSGFDNDFWKLINKFTSHPVYQKNNTDLALKAYPNPVSDILYLKSYTNQGFITIYDILGNKISETEKSHHIDFTNLESGIYILKFRNNSQTEFLRIIKK